MVPSLFLCLRVSILVKARRSVALSGHGRMTLGPARKRAMGVCPVSELTLRLYSCSTQGGVPPFSLSRLKSATCSSMAINLPSTEGPEDLDLGVALRGIGERRLL